MFKILVNFSNPSIIVRCCNYGAVSIENFTLQVTSSDLNLKFIPEVDQKNIGLSRSSLIYLDKLACDSSFEALYLVSNYASGRHIIRASTTQTLNENTKLKSNHFAEVVLPNPWIINRFDFNFKKSEIFSLDIYPDFHNENMNVLRIGTDNSNQISEFNFVINYTSDLLVLKFIFRNWINSVQA